MSRYQLRTEQQVVTGPSTDPGPVGAAYGPNSEIDIGTNARGSTAPFLVKAGLTSLPLDMMSREVGHMLGLDDEYRGAGEEGTG
ncbi:MAG: hypothetical protein ABMB14_16800 [Myxococcota bacterium]